MLVARGRTALRPAESEEGDGAVGGLQALELERTVGSKEDCALHESATLETATFLTLRFFSVKLGEEHLLVLQY